MNGSKSLIFGIFLALIDVLVLSLLKAKYVGKITSNWVLVMAFIIYGLQPIIFYKALYFENMTIMNIIWDLASDILVAIVGYYIFNEDLTYKQKIGFIFGLIALILLK